MGVALAGVMLASCASQGGDGADLAPADTDVAPGSKDSVCEVGQVDGDLNLYMRGGSIDRSILELFEETYEVEVLADEYDSVESVEPKLSSGAAYDAVAALSTVVDDLARRGLIQELEAQLIPNLADVHPFFRTASSDPESEYSATYRWGTVGVGTNTESVPGEAGWSALFDAEVASEYPQGVILSDDARITIAAALMYLGYSPNSRDEGEVAEAARVVVGLGNVAFDSSGYVSVLNEGEADAALGFSDAFVDTSEQIEFSIPAEGTFVWTDSISIPSAASHVCTAHTFIDFVLGADQGPRLTQWDQYASTRAGAGAYVEADDGGSGLVANPAANFEVLTDSDELAEMYEHALAVARSLASPSSS